MPGSRIGQTLARTLVCHISTSQYQYLLYELSQDVLDSEQNRELTISRAAIVIDLLQDDYHQDVEDGLKARQQGFDAVLALIRQLVHGGGTEDDDEGMHMSVELCAKYDPLLHAMIQDCIANLLSQIHELSNDADAFAIPSEEALDLLFRSMQTSSREANSGANHTIGSSLAFLKLLAWRKLLKRGAVLQDILLILLVLVGSVSLPVSSQARDTICAILTRRNDEEPSTTFAPASYDPFSVLLWDRIVELSQDSSPAHCKSCAYAIWLNAILSNSTSFPSQEKLYDTQYWAILHQGLGHGSYEQQKSSLAVARTSMTKIENDLDNDYVRFEVGQSEEYNMCFGKFCTVYETITSRYLNQVQACLPDLEVLAKDTTKIHKAWLVTLITAALDPGNQESIRNVVGIWSMKFLPEILTQCVTVSPRFLERFFLPWVSTGSLFIATIGREEHENHVCWHGERLTLCLRDLIKTMATMKDKEAIAKAVLMYLRSQAGRIFAAARVFLLEGIRQGLSGESPCLDDQDLTCLVNIGNMGGFQDVMNDFMVFQCAGISQCAISESSDKGYHQLIKAADYLAKEPEQTTISKEIDAAAFLFPTQFPSTYSSGEHTAPEPSMRSPQPEFNLRNLVGILDVTKQQCLKGHGMQATCDYLNYVLDNSLPEDIVPEQLERMLDAIWEEIGKQYYPKRILMQIPTLILHPMCARKCSPSSSLAKTISTIIGKLQKLVEKRIYAFAPFAKALRRCLLQSHQDSHLPVVGAFVQLANRPPTAKTEFQLATAVATMFSQEVPFRNSEYYLGKSAGYGWGCVFDALNRWPEGEVRLARQIVDQLLAPWAAQKHPVPVFSKWKTSVQMQMVLILVQRIIGTLSSDELDSYLTKLDYILSLEPLPRYRYLLEWAILRIYMQRPERRRQVLKSLDRPDLSNPKHVVSRMKIAASIAHLDDAVEEFAYDHMLQLNIFAANPKIVLRHEAQWQFPPLWEVAIRRGWHSIVTNPCLSRFNDFVLALATYHNPPASRLLEKFHPVRGHNLTHLLSGPYLDLEPSEEARLHRGDLLAVWRDAAVSAGNDDENMIMPLGHEQSTVKSDNATSSDLIHSPEGSMSETITSVPLQIKASTWNPAAITANGHRRNTTRLVVVASFVDSAYNLGGITRASEILGAEALYVRNPSAMLKEQAFTTLSVSSELWLPIQDLAPADVPSFLVDKKVDGFEVVGIEQTDQSRVLGGKESVFKEKTVLVLGSEKKGIPATVLRECDWCVEIEQRGVTRSMNVQTAAACVLYEYVRQQKR